tara:strand:- start:26667 stop:27398 length:732 start_codon:yes stop_codon:yes gene_type:complete
MTQLVQTPTFSPAGWSFSHERRRGPKLPDSLGVLFDFDPAYSMTQDRKAGLSCVQGGTGAVTREVHNGRYCAVFNGANYLDFAGSLFDSLSDLTAQGGVSIEVVYEGSVNASAVCLYNSEASDTSDRILNYDDANEKAGIYVYNATPAFRAAFDDAGNTALKAVGFHATTTQRTCSSGGTEHAAGTAGGIDPAGLNRLVIGAGASAGAPGAFPTTGRVYRVLVRAGGFSSAVDAVLSPYYLPA